MDHARFKGVKDLVFRGFLSTKVEVGGITMMLKSLNTTELDSIRDQCPFKTSASFETVFENLMIAYAIYMFEGENVLAQRPSSLLEMKDALSELPSSLKNELLREVYYLQRAQDSALRMLEAYSYLADSRHTWRARRGHRMNDPYLTGIAGTDHLGLSSHQVAWVWLNEEEDERLRSEEQWSFSKFIASASNAKGVKKLDGKDKARLKRIKEERQRIIAGESYQGPQRIEPHSVKELKKQLVADLEGTKDLHDRIIDAYEASIQKRRADHRLRQEELVEEARLKRESELDSLTDEELLSGAGFVTVLNKEQLDQRRAEQGQARMKYVQEMNERRKAASQRNKDDRRIATEDIRKFVRETEGESEVVPKTPQTPPPSRIDTRPRANPRLTKPTPETRRPEPPLGAKQVGTRPDGTPRYYTPDPNSGGEAPDGFSKREENEARPSKMLTRHTYGNPNTRRIPGVGAKKGRHTTHIDKQGEDDFFAGGSSTPLTDKKK